VRHAVALVFFLLIDWDCLALTCLYCLVTRSPLANVDDGKSGPPPRRHFQGAWSVGFNFATAVSASTDGGNGKR